MSKKFWKRKKSPRVQNQSLCSTNWPKLFMTLVLLSLMTKKQQMIILKNFCPACLTD